MVLGSTINPRYCISILQSWRVQIRLPPVIEGEIMPYREQRIGQCYWKKQCKCKIHIAVLAYCCKLCCSNNCWHHQIWLLLTTMLFRVTLSDTSAAHNSWCDVTLSTHHTDAAWCTYVRTYACDTHARPRHTFRNFLRQHSSTPHSRYVRLSLSVG